MLFWIPRIGESSQRLKNHLNLNFFLSSTSRVQFVKFFDIFYIAVFLLGMSGAQTHFPFEFSSFLIVFFSYTQYIDTGLMLFEWQGDSRIRSNRNARVWCWCVSGDKKKAKICVERARALVCVRLLRNKERANVKLSIRSGPGDDDVAMWQHNIH